MNNNALPIILQHVRELAEAQMPVAESEYFKLITPFPPEFNDFPDFLKENLAFTDTQTDAAEALKDTMHACEFFNATDGLYYNYSYGLKSQENTLSGVCKLFFSNASFVNTDDTGFIENFNEKKEALRRFKRTTVGDLGNLDFYFSSPSAVQWSPGKIILTGNELKRLKEKTLNVYKNLSDSGSDYLTSLVAEIETSAYSRIEYQFGFFEVARGWIDPLLFENKGWKLNSGSEALYGENNKDFDAGDIKLCYAQRYYVIRNYSCVLAAAATVSPRRVTAASPPTAVAGSISVHDHRTVVRNTQISRKLLPLKHAVSVADARGNYIWVKDHWERKKAGVFVPPSPEVITPANSVYKVAAVKCRIIPPKPVSG